MKEFFMLFKHYKTPDKKQDLMNIYIASHFSLILLDFWASVSSISIRCSKSMYVFNPEGSEFVF